MFKIYKYSLVVLTSNITRTLATATHTLIQMKTLASAVTLCSACQHIQWYTLQYISMTNTQYIVNTPARAKLAIEDEHKPAHCFAFFSGSQKTLKFKLIR